MPPGAWLQPSEHQQEKEVGVVGQAVDGANPCAGGCEPSGNAVTESSNAVCAWAYPVDGVDPWSQDPTNHGLA